MSGPGVAFFLALAWNGMCLGAVNAHALGRAPAILDIPLWLAVGWLIFSPWLFWVLGLTNKSHTPDTRGVSEK